MVATMKDRQRQCLARWLKDRRPELRASGSGARFFGPTAPVARGGAPALSYNPLFGGCPGSRREGADAADGEEDDDGGVPHDSPLLFAPIFGGGSTPEGARELWTSGRAAVEVMVGL